MVTVSQAAASAARAVHGRTAPAVASSMRPAQKLDIERGAQILSFEGGHMAVVNALNVVSKVGSSPEGRRATRAEHAGVHASGQLAGGLDSGLIVTLTVAPRVPHIACVVIPLHERERGRRREPP